MYKKQNKAKQKKTNNIYVQAVSIFIWLALSLTDVV